MGRKKKKTQSDQEDEIHTDLLSAAVPPQSQDWISLRLLSTKKGKSTDSPQLFITEHDALQLDLLNDDKVVLVTQDREDDFRVAICSARIVPLQESPVKTKTQSSRSALSPGACQVVPPQLMERMCTLSVDKKHPMDDKANSDSISHADSSAELPSKSGFSFARGGGGDLLISSPRKVSLDVTKTMLPTVNVWVVPTFTSLGTQITSSLCQLASKITLSSATSIPQNALKVVQKLVSEKLTERYVARGETIGISFRGKPLYLTVEDVTTIDDDIDKLEAAVSELHLNDEIDSSTHLLRAVYSAIKDPMRQAKFRLFHIDSKTTAIMASQNQEQERPTSLNQGPFVAGLDDIIQQVKSTILTAMFHPEAYGQLKGPRGCLIFGAHGVGKSALAKQLMVEMRDDHEEVDVEFVHCASLQSLTSTVGEGERRLAKLFDRTKKTLLILDDIHFICPRRGSGAGVDRIAATLLALLDGVISKSDVYVIATTTDPSLLDPALRRPGRLDAEVEIPIPDERTRAKIWKFHLDNMNRGEEIALDAFSESDMVELAASAKGFNGADCMLALKEAARIAAKSSVDEPIVNVKNLRSAIAATKPSTISSITVEVPHVYWSSIGGMQDVKDKLREAIELPLTHADLFAKLSIPPPRGVLLYGPPGCSKTLMARALATEGRMNFLAVKGPELLSKWLGESERALATLFRRARMASPCTIFFDEVDAIAAKRGSGQSGAGGERLLSQLLTELDGVGNRKEGHVIVVAATNRPDLLDHALTRPGRIDRKIYVGLPDKNSREQIFRIGLKGRAYSPDIDFEHLASDEASGGFSGAEIIGICRDSALLAIEEFDEKMDVEDNLRIHMRHLRSAIDSTPRQVTSEMLNFYEAYSVSNPV